MRVATLSTKVKTNSSIVTISIEGVDPLIILGPRDINLQLLQKAYPNAGISARGGEIMIQASDEDYIELKSILTEMISIGQRTGNLSDRDMHTIITIRRSIDQAKKTKNDSSVPGITDELIPGTPPPDSDVIVYTHGGGSVRAKTAGQQRIVDAHKTNDIVFAIGPAGTGKTYTAVALAVKALKERKVKRIVLCRPAVEAGESLGFLPGDLKDKIDPYLRPLYDALHDMVGAEQAKTYLERQIVEVAPLAFMRGRTLNNSFVILDEAQNTTPEQMKMFLTRIGFGTKVVVTGDTTQVDVPDGRSGLLGIERILTGIKDLTFVHLNADDVVRHRIVADIVAAYEKVAPAPSAHRAGGH